MSLPFQRGFKPDPEPSVGVFAASAPDYHALPPPAPPNPPPPPKPPKPRPDRPRLNPTLGKAENKTRGAAEAPALTPGDPRHQRHRDYKKNHGNDGEDRQPSAGRHLNQQHIVAIQLNKLDADVSDPFFRIRKYGRVSVPVAAPIFRELHPSSRQGARIFARPDVRASRGFEPDLRALHRRLLILRGVLPRMGSL